MNQVLEFGKKYAKWIAAGTAAVAVAVVGYVAYKHGEDEEYVVLETEQTEADEEN